MTAGLHNNLAERVAKAISRWRWDQRTDEPWERLKPSVQQAFREQAQAAIDTCQAEEMVEALKSLADAVDAHDPSPELDAEVYKARALLTKLDGRR